MKFAIFSLDKELIRAYRKIIQKNFIYGELRPDIVVSLGGDGTFLMGERLYPGVPKLLIRNSSICNKCDWDSLSPILDKLKRKEFRIEENMKLHTEFKGGKKLAVNDFVIRNKTPTHAIRFLLSVNGKQLDGELIGDGVVVSTPFGSTAYYYSIAKRKFDKGIGIAFNNLSNETEHKIIDENSIIEIEITRGDATFSYDNDTNILILKTGDKLRIKKSHHVARIVKIGK